MNRGGQSLETLRLVHSLRDHCVVVLGNHDLSLLAIGGGITTVLIPQENEKDLADIPANVKEGLNIIPVSNVREVLRHALVRMPEPMEWDEAAWEIAEAKRLAALRDGTATAATAH